MILRLYLVGQRGLDAAPAEVCKCHYDRVGLPALEACRSGFNGLARAVLRLASPHPKPDESRTARQRGLTLTV